MKLIGEINGAKHDIEIERDGENVAARIDGREYNLTVSEVEPDVFLFKHDNRIYQIYVAPNGIVNVNNHQLEINLIDPKRLRGTKSADAESGASEIKTAMPGKLVRVLVEVGTKIKQGAGVLIVEAMKMQNEMKAPRDGIIKEIRFAEGATVNAGDVLAIIE